MCKSTVDTSTLECKCDKRETPLHLLVRLPRALTAANGAKALLIGEFKEAVQISCPECAGDEEREDCFICHGQGVVNQDVLVQWDTIKRIYAKIVENLAI